MGTPPRANGHLAGFWAGIGLGLMLLGLLLDYAGEFLSKGMNDTHYSLHWRLIPHQSIS